MTADMPLLLHAESVRPEWIDYNGHLSEAYYVLVFGHATDALYDHIGLDADYRRRSRCSAYTVEAHINYLGEVAARSDLTCATRVLGFDPKRIHIHHEMFAGDARPATIEIMALHVDTETGKTCAMADVILARLAALPVVRQPSPGSRAIALA